MRNSISTITAVLLLTALVPANAGTSTLTLRRSSLTNVNDAAGLWQYEAGTVLVNNKQVGFYGATRRVMPVLTTPLNTSMYTLTLFFRGANPNTNITFQGAWNFNPGGGIGGVSAASAPYQFLQHDGTFSVNSGNVLTINWTGGGTVP
jgi:hypothetical protein